jgi:pimeloyl-ACP methyl ester carboxylesterase
VRNSSVNIPNSVNSVNSGGRRRSLIALTVVSALSASMMAYGPVSAKAAKPGKKPKPVVTADAKAVVSQGEDGKYKFPRRTTDWTVPPAAKFSSCFEDVECATVLAPMNYADKRSPMIELNVTRRKAKDPARRLGAMFVNPGGPGGGTTGLVRFSARIFPTGMSDQFDIIGLDPRGTEKSTPVICGGEPDTRSANFDAIWTQFAKACGNQSGQYLDFVDTVSAARDHDWVRQALGESKINFLGFSYGGYLGAVYADLYPQTLRSVILDSGLDHTVFGIAIKEQKAFAWERSVNAFLTACSNGSLTPCAFNDGTDLLKRYESILAKFPNLKLLANPQSGRQAEFDDKVLSLLADRQEGWPILATSLAAAANSDRPEKEIKPIKRGSSGINLVDSFPFFIAYSCRDGQFNRDAALEKASYDRLFTIAPHMAAAAVGFGIISVCRFWPSPALAQPPVTPNGIVPVLLIGSLLDLQAPIEWQRSMQATTGGVLITRDGTTHGAIPDSKCVADFAVTFVTQLQLPPVGTTCAS